MLNKLSTKNSLIYSNNWTSLADNVVVGPSFLARMVNASTDICYVTVGKTVPMAQMRTSRTVTVSLARSFHTDVRTAHALTAMHNVTEWWTVLMVRMNRNKYVDLRRLQHHLPLLPVLVLQLQYREYGYRIVWFPSVLMNVDVAVKLMNAHFHHSPQMDGMCWKEVTSHSSVTRIIIFILPNITLLFATKDNGTQAFLNVQVSGNTNIFRSGIPQSFLIGCL